MQSSKLDRIFNLLFIFLLSFPLLNEGINHAVVVRFDRVVLLGNFLLGGVRLYKYLVRMDCRSTGRLKGIFVVIKYIGYVFVESKTRLLRELELETEISHIFGILAI